MFYKTVDASALAVNTQELSRRLSSPNDMFHLDDERYKRLVLAASPSYAAERVAIKRTGEGVFIGNIYTNSAALRRVCSGCEECFVMTCTLGHGVDKLIAKESHLSVVDAFYIDALADALIESLCDLAERELCDSLTTRPRFSPGYSDLPLSVGQEIVKLLGSEIRQGIKFTDSEMMIPRKSVSAIICIQRSVEEI